MEEKDYSKVIARNLRNLIYEKGKSQAEVARDLGINKATLSSWMNATRTPKMANIDMLCDYFDVKRSALMEPYPHKKAQTISEEQAELIRITMTADPENVHLILEIMRRLEDRL